mmetsp:Transcript_39298/g.80530  ORF Transcript_39298/g.80530 Transcript_39298/m.80530 type:complete len:561 (-) Transcript_39298:2287-3969(-)
MSDASSASSSSSGGPSAVTPAVHLGFSEPIEHAEDVETIAHNSPIWSDWDGGKIGGRPSWLNPRDVPVGPLRCRACAKRNALASKSADSMVASDANADGGESSSADQKVASETRDVNAHDGSRTPATTESATIMRFLCQTYCPADAESNPRNEAAFHRTIYVFACPSIECSTSPSPDSVLVLRGQLSKENDFYPAITKDRENDFDSWEKHKSASWDANLCEVCGCKAGGRCPKQNLWFCCREHQKEHLKCCRTKNGSANNEEDDRNVKLLPSLYAESELVVEDEPSVKKTTNDEEERLRQEMDKVAMFSTSEKDEKMKDGVGKEEEELDENLEQTDLNDMTGAAGTGTSDAATLEFYSRIGTGDGGVKDQCLRYCRWHEAEGECDDKNAFGSDVNADVDVSTGGGGPLWVSSRDIPSKNDISSCQHCGAPRKFELQLMPQMLSYLFGDRSQDKTRDAVASEEVRAALLAASNIAEQAKWEGREGELPSDFKKRHDGAVQKVRNALLVGGSSAKQGGDGMDWGVIAVYTCTASCGDGIVNDGTKMGAYREEFAWRQQPLGV